ncbi:methyltransferase [Kribbella sp. CA-294648]|uniref:methyltransferase n=1 Tax=Kribbella sp. CA-294648 TaxID=3239948 RepID=UPI003D943C9E
MNDQSAQHPTGGRPDDKKLWDVVFGAFGYPAVLIAHKLRIFAMLADGPASLAELCRATQLERRPAQAILSVACSLGFLENRAGNYHLTPVATRYLTPGGPDYFGAYWDFMIENHKLFTFETLEKAVLDDAPQGHTPEWRMRQPDSFVAAMRSIGASASTWPELLDLTENRMLLDIGGGPATHAMAAVRKWPNLRATVFDLEYVTAIAQEDVERQGLSDRVQMRAGDMWTDPFPAADLHLYSYVFHTQPIEKCGFLARKSFASLPPGGRAIVHQVFYDADKTGPFAAAAFAVEMLSWNSGEQYSTSEISKVLAEAGFADLQLKATFGYCSMIIGTKPNR